MATMAGFFNRFWARGPERAETAAVRPMPFNERDTRCRLRAFPNEDVYFFVKRIDNSRVVRQADPAAGGRCWKSIGATFAASSIAIGLLLPGAYGLLAGYRIESLKQEQQRLIEDRSALELEEARLLSPERLQELARLQQFIEPSPESVVYLHPKADGQVAMNTGKK